MQSLRTPVWETPRDNACIDRVKPANMFNYLSIAALETYLLGNRPPDDGVATANSPFSLLIHLKLQLVHCFPYHLSPTTHFQSRDEAGKFVNRADFCKTKTEQKWIYLTCIFSLYQLVDNYSLPAVSYQFSVLLCRTNICKNEFFMAQHEKCIKHSSLRLRTYLSGYRQLATVSYPCKQFSF